MPAEYAQVLGITTLVCTPLSAAGRAYGVICADRGGGRFELSDGERHLLWTLGKTAALVATARNATRQQERSRRLGERLDLAREIHERVLQRLFGVSLALSAEQPLEPAERERCRVGDAGGDRRSAPRARAAAGAGAAGDRAHAGRRARAAAGARSGRRWRSTGRRRSRSRSISSRWPSRCWPRRCATSAKHAAGHGVEVAVARDADTFTLEVRNDGVRAGARGRGDGAAAGGVRGAAARRRGRVRAPRRRRLAGPAGRAARAGDAAVSDAGDRRGRSLPRVKERGCACSWSTTTTSCTGASGCCSASSRGCERCLAARTGAEALELTQTFEPDVALVDLFLAGESGADVCESIRQASPSTRVLLISGAGRMSPAAARAAGASGFVSKDLEAARGGQGGADGRDWG